MSFINALATRITVYRKDLPHPGRPDDLYKKSQNVLASYLVFDGAKFDLAKGLSNNMQITHSFSLGSKFTPPAYNFAAVFVKDDILMTGAVDNDGGGSAQLRIPVCGKDAAIKLIMQKMQKQTMFRSEIEYSGPDYHLSASTINPSPLEGKGMFTASYLQSITPRLMLGAEVSQVRTSALRMQAGAGGVASAGVADPLSFVSQLLNGPSLATKAPGGNTIQSPLEIETTGALHARLMLPRYVLPASPNDEMPASQPTADPLIMASIRSSGILTAAYYHPVSSKAELAAELELAANSTMRQGIARVGAKYDFRQSCFRTMMDTEGKVSSVLELKMGPGVTFTLSGELDHVQSQSRFGVGFQLEI